VQNYQFSVNLLTNIERLEEKFFQKVFSVFIGVVFI